MQTEKQRERLVELIRYNTMLTDRSIEAVVDACMKNGVIVPPYTLKVGDKVYRKMCRGFNDFYLREETVWIVDMHFTAGLEIITKYVETKGITLLPKIDIEDIGKTVFLSREEAEKVLKERKEKEK